MKKIADSISCPNIYPLFLKYVKLSNDNFIIRDRGTTQR